MMNKKQVTLKQLRKHKACVSGYNKVVCALKGVDYTDNKKTYMGHKHGDPISLLFILESNGLDDALWCLRCNKDWDCDARLYAVWCARQVQHLMTDKRSIAALDVAEKFALRLATDEELTVARDAAAQAAAWDVSRDAVAFAAESAAAWAAVNDAAWFAARDAAWAAELDVAEWAAARDAQKEMFIRMCNGNADWQQKESK
jgi:hypothetical protein